MNFFLQRKIIRNNYKEDFLKNRNNNLIIFMSLKVNNNNSLLRLFRQTTYGIGIKYYIKNLSFKYGLSPFLSLIFLSNFYISLYQNIFRESFLNYERIKIINQKINLKKILKLYVSRRQLLKLPSRGQRSKTNAGTSKKKINFYIKF